MRGGSGAAAYSASPFLAAGTPTSPSHVASATRAAQPPALSDVSYVTATPIRNTNAAQRPAQEITATRPGDFEKDEGGVRKQGRVKGGGGGRSGLWMSGGVIPLAGGGGLGREGPARRIQVPLITPLPPAPNNK